MCLTNKTLSLSVIQPLCCIYLQYAILDPICMFLFLDNSLVNVYALSQHPALLKPSAQLLFALQSRPAVYGARKSKSADKSLIKVTGVKISVQKNMFTLAGHVLYKNFSIWYAPSCCVSSPNRTSLLLK